MNHSSCDRSIYLTIYWLNKLCNLTFLCIILLESSLMSGWIKWVEVSIKLSQSQRLVFPWKVYSWHSRGWAGGYVSRGWVQTPHTASLPTIHKAPTSALTTGVLMRETAMPNNTPFAILFQHGSFTLKQLWFSKTWLAQFIYTFNYAITDVAL